MHKHTVLALLQQSEYDLHYFNQWWQKHHADTIDTQPDSWTLKLKLVSFWYDVLRFLPVPTRLAVALKLIWPVETVARWYILHRAKTKLRRLQKNGLKVVAIAGSYAKTSTKHILYHSLKQYQNVLMTEKSINTPLGIAGVIQSQLTSQHQLFIAELGEYYAGDIKDLTELLQPNWGIITPVGKQHLERMGSLTSVAATIGELLDFFHEDQTRALVVDSNREYYPDFTGDWYGLSPTANYRAHDITISRRGTEAVITTPSETSLKVFLPLYGAHQLSNALPSLWLATKLGLVASQVSNQLPGLPYISRRHEPHFGANNILILDNSYNTNPDSARASLTLLNQLDATQRVVVTLGFVELGETSHQEHYRFGQLLAKQADLVALAQGEYTDAIRTGFLEVGGQPDHIVVGKDLDQAYALVSGTIKPGAVILFEGGYREILV